MEQYVCNEFNTILDFFPTNLKNILLQSPNIATEKLLEIRLRKDLPIVFKKQGAFFYLTKNSEKTMLESDTLVKATQEDLNFIVQKASKYSIHSYQEDLCNGYLTTDSGHRIGLVGTAVYDSKSGFLSGIKNIVGLNIRLTSIIDGSANLLIQACFQDEILKNILILGAPLSGKTVMLRDLCKQISNGVLSKIYTCVVIDERHELAVSSMNAKNSLGMHTDILSKYSKADGISLAVRVLSPDIIFCDEIGSAEDVRAILNGIRCGVHFITTAHASSLEEARQRPAIQMLLQENVFDYVVCLNREEKIGSINQVIGMNHNNEMDRNSIYFNRRNIFCNDTNSKESRKSS